MDDVGNGPAAGREGEGSSRPRNVGEGIRQGLSMLSALRDALEEAIGDARERGDLSPERAREAVRAAVHRVQEAAGGAKERLDLVSRRELDQLREHVDELRVRLENLERRAAQGPGAGPSHSTAEGSGEGAGEGPG